MRSLGIKLSHRVLASTIPAMLLGVFFLFGCEQKQPTSEPPSSATSQEQMEREYREVLMEAGLYSGGAATPPAQIEAGRYGQLLLTAAGHGSPELLARLLAARADVNLNEAYEGRTLLHAAAATLQAGNCDLLLERGMDPNARDNLGRTPLHLAVALPQGAVLARLLLSRGAQVDIRDEQGMTPLLSAAPSSLKLLADKGADLSARDSQGSSALHWAVYRRSYEATEILTGQGAAPDIQNGAGRTPLHLAVELGDPRLAQLLLNAGARQDITDSSGQTPLQMAEKSRDAKLRQAFGL